MMAPQAHIYDGVTPAHIKKFYENMAKERLNINHPNGVIKIEDEPIHESYMNNTLSQLNINKSNIQNSTQTPITVDIDAMEEYGAKHIKKRSKKGKARPAANQIDKGPP